jgi:hypothetical protein
MKHAPARAARTKVREIEGAGKRKVDVEKFTPDITPTYFMDLVGPVFDATTFGILFFPIEVLGPTKTVGLGRTNLTVIESTILQADAATPYIGFDRTKSPQRNPTIQMHFQAGAYGITGTGTYVMAFAVECFGSCTFNAQGGAVPASGGGTKVMNGKGTISLVFNGVKPTDQIYGFIEQTAGAAWNCYSVRVRYPGLVIKP